MFQQFFKDTLISRFIKRLLRATNIPLIHIIHRDSEIIEGCLYLFENYVIRCVESGRFYVDPNQALYPGDTIYPSMFILPSAYIETNEIIDGKKIRKPRGTYKLAKYQVVKYYDENDMQIHYNYHSKFIYYDPDTHFHLGEYLRYLRDREDLNLMPFYNCFNNKSIVSAHIHGKDPQTEKTFSTQGNKDYKVLAVPVKFGQTYTIAIDSDTPVHLRSLIYNEDSGCIIKNINEKPLHYYSDEIDDYECLQSSNFIKPYLKVIPTATNSALYSQEKNLYLIIQVSKENNSAVTVLEGNHLNAWNKVVSNAERYTENYHYYKNLSLLHFNAHSSVAFSDRLIEYLLLNVINKTETIDKNIEYVQDLITNNSSDFKFNYKGIWSDNIRLAISALENEKLKDNLIRDLDGYLNKDMERILSKGVS